MKKIIAIIRNECVAASRSALDRIGIHGIVSLVVRGQCRKTGLIREGNHDASLPGGSLDHGPQRREERAAVPEQINAGYVKEGTVQEAPLKTMLVMAVSDENVFPAIQELIRINQTGQHGDGKIIVCPMVSIVGLGSGKDRETSAL